MVFFPVSFRIIIAIMPSIVRVQYALKMQCVTCLHDDMCKSAAALLCTCLHDALLCTCLHDALLCTCLHAAALLCTCLHDDMCKSAAALLCTCLHDDMCKSAAALLCTCLHDAALLCTCLHDDMCKSAAALLCNLLRKGPLHIATMPAFQPSTLESTCFSAHMIAVSSIERLLPLPMLQL